MSEEFVNLGPKFRAITPAAHAGKKRKRGSADVKSSASKDKPAGGPSKPAKPASAEVPKPSKASSISHPARNPLPVWNHVSSICKSLLEHDVLLLVGETGSGKSTQIPQMLATQPWCDKCIAITQPRRVAAISLARRVAQEMGSPPPGHPQAKVGYSVRFDQKIGPQVKIKFLTEGMLLQELHHDPNLSQYSAVIVDEVHERSVNVDLILGFVKRLVRANDKKQKGQKKFKSVVMSATADVQALFAFFTDQEAAAESPFDIGVSSGMTMSLHVQGRQHPVSMHYLPEPTNDFPEAAMNAVFKLHYGEPLPGDILVFLTGQDIVESVERQLNDYAAVMDPGVPKLKILPLFAALPQTAQQEVFEPTPPGHRKVVLATNIAETSVTIPGVRFVVDCGLAKVKEFRSQLGLDSLLVKPISKSSAIQRAGRAGREGPGKAFRLYTEKDYSGLASATPPEILRCDLTAALLAIKARGIVDVLEFPYLTRPKTTYLRKALLSLWQLGALRESGQISGLGKRMARMPLPPHLARVLLVAAKTGAHCLLPVIDIISCLSADSVFLQVNTDEKKEAAETHRRELYRREGDHLTLWATVQAFATASDRKAWALERFVSYRAMRNVMDVRKQLHELCLRLGMLDKHASTDSPPYTPEGGEQVLRCFLRGFFNNTARLMPDGSYQTLEGNQTVAVHPSSVLFGRKVEAIMYNELVFTVKCYARGVSAITVPWYGEAACAAGFDEEEG